MCGIVGFYSSKISNPQKTIQKMEDILKHRGPNAAGTFCCQDFAMGMRRLAIIDLKTGSQPIFNEDKTIAIVFNGEIYNFRDLRQTLQKKGHQFKSHTDTETLVHLYEEYGEKMFKQIDGMFSFCIYDNKKQILLLGRDPLGKKPLYYYFQNQEFVFASEVKALLCFPHFKKQVDLKSTVKYFTFGYLPRTESIFQNINKLLPGFYLTFDIATQKLVTKQYWNLHFTPQTNLTEQEIIPCLEKKLMMAVKKRLLSDVPLGVFLSGGIDSSLIVAMMAHCLKGKTIKTFSIGFQEKKYDESRFAKIVASRYQTDHHLKIFKAEQIFTVLSEIVRKLDEPLADPSLLPTYLLSQFAKEEVDVALSGDGGDEIFGGYPKYFVQHYLKFYDYLPKWIKKNLAPHIIQYLPLKPEHRFFNYKLQKFIQSAQYAAPYRNQFWAGPFTPEEISRNLIPHTEIKEEWFFEDANYFLKQFSGQNCVDQMMYLDTKLILPEMYLYKVDRMSMATSLEVRSPFLDREVVKFAASLPHHLKVHGQTTKYILKKIAAKYLPREIINRFKQGFGMPLALWIKNLTTEILNLIPADLPPGINTKYIRYLIQEHQRGKDQAIKIWSIYLYLLWYNKFFSGGPN